MLDVLYHLVEVSAAFVFLFPLLTTIAAAICRRRPEPDTACRHRDIAVIITAYNNGRIAIPLIESLLRQQYGQIHIYLVADGCDRSQLPQFPANVSVLIPAQKLNSKVKSIRLGIDRFVREHEAVIIFDPDNVAHPEFLKIINGYLAKGFLAVQGRRIAKNLDSLYASLDALGEVYYNHITRQALYQIGSSAVIAGSGMAIETALLRKILSAPELAPTKRVIAAEDKIFQEHIVRSGKRIAFAGNALVYDEKVSTGAQVTRQRTRWLYSYFEYVRKAIVLMFSGIVRRNFNMFYFGLATAVPPLIVVLGSAFTMLLLSLLLKTGTAVCWIAGWLLFSGNVFYILAAQNADRRIWRSLWGIPLFLWKQCFSLLNMKESKKDFMVTTHTKHYRIDDILLAKERIDR
jgi:cellulose synthase/poly-beta-1,6-N-acetylglucosamine synthase-like glycosyltransferase